MERIQRALELARRDREQGRNNAAVAVATVVASPRPSTATRAARLPLSPDVLERNRVLGSGGDAAVRAAYRMLRTQVLQRMREHALQTLAIVSPGSGEGKSLTAANLAISIAEDAGHHALLVDFDLRRPNLAGLFGLTPTVGLDDYLRGEARLEEVICRPEPFERLAVLPVRAPVERSSELLTGAIARAFVAEVRGRYADRVVVFDLPPVLASDDALAFSPLVDAALVVAAEGRTRRDDLRRCIDLLRATRIVGTVLNNSADVGARAY